MRGEGATSLIRLGLRQGFCPPTFVSESNSLMWVRGALWCCSAHVHTTVVTCRAMALFSARKQWEHLWGKRWVGEGGIFYRGGRLDKCVSACVFLYLPVTVWLAWHPDQAISGAVWAAATTRKAMYDNPSYMRHFFNVAAATAPTLALGFLGVGVRTQPCHACV